MKRQIAASKKEKVFNGVRDAIERIFPEGFLPVTIVEKEVIYANGESQPLGTFTKVIGQSFGYDDYDMKRMRSYIQDGMEYDTNGLTNLVIGSKVKFLDANKCAMKPYKEKIPMDEQRLLDKYDTGTAYTQSDHEEKPSLIRRLINRIGL